jgi:DNA-binding NarL/FixJ family response regulator
MKHDNGEMNEGEWVSRPVKPTTDWKDLSRRQQQVAKLLVRGLSAKEISQQLLVASPAVEFHIVRLFETTGSTTRASFSAWMAAHGPRAEEQGS